MTPPEFSKLWRVTALPGVSFFKASFLHHAFSKHAHEEYAIGASESGIETFHCRGGRHWATPGSLILVNPADLHDGRPVGDGYSYRMIYVAPEVFEKAASARGHWLRLKPVVGQRPTDQGGSAGDTGRKCPAESETVPVWDQYSTKRCACGAPVGHRLYLLPCELAGQSTANVERRVPENIEAWVVEAVHGFCAAFASLTILRRSIWCLATDLRL